MNNKPNIPTTVGLAINKFNFPPIIKILIIDNFSSFYTDTLNILIIVIHLIFLIISIILAIIIFRKIFK